MKLLKITTSLVALPLILTCKSDTIGPLQDHWALSMDRDQTLQELKHAFDSADIESCLEYCSWLKFNFRGTIDMMYTGTILHDAMVYHSNEAYDHGVQACYAQDRDDPVTRDQELAEAASEIHGLATLCEVAKPTVGGIALGGWCWWSVRVLLHMLAYIVSSLLAQLAWDWLLS